MNIKKCLWLFFLCFLSAPSIQAQRNYIDIPNYILCINSYAESTPWSTRMISTISEYVQKDPQLALYAEHMNTFMIDNDSILKEFKNMLSQKYTQPHPRLLGGSRNLVGIIVSYSHPKFRPLPHGNKSTGGVGSHRASL